MARSNEEDNKTYLYWEKQIHAALKDREPYIRRTEAIEKLYRGNDHTRNANTSSNSFNILYTNTNTTLPLLYAEPPKAEVRARNNVSQPQVREAAQILEDVLDYSIDAYDLDGVLSSLVFDYELYAMGVGRVVYTPIMEKVAEATRVKGVDELSEEGEELAEDAGVAIIVTPEHEKVIYEEVSCEYVYYQDLLYPDAKRWEDVPWIAFRGMHTRDELVEKFGEEIGNRIKLDQTIEGGDTSDDFKRATVWEIWDKDNRQRLHLANGYNKVFEIEDDPMSLRSFYPIPKPLFGEQTTSTLTPIPLYVFYQDQATELNEVSKRITKLTKELKRRGVYDASVKGLSRVISANDNTFVGIDEWNQFVEKGGINNVIAEMDIQNIANVVISLYTQRDQILQIIYQIIGLGDIQRAVTDPRETFGAQKMKGKYGTLRISSRQRAVAKYIKNLLALKAEVISEQFEATTIAIVGNVQPKEIEVTGVDGQLQTREIDPIEYVRDVIKPIIEDQEPRQVVIEIETDSTVAVDEEAEQAQAVEFTQLLGNFAQSAPLLAEAYGMEVTTKLLVEMLKKFKLSRRMQQEFIERIEEMREQAENPPPPQPSFEEQKLQVETQIETAKLQLEAEKFTVQSQLKAKELELKEVELGLKAELEFTQQQFDMAQAISEFELNVEKLNLESINPNKNIVAES